MDISQATANKLALKTAKTTSRGLNTDFLGSPEEVSSLAEQYDQVQFSNGNEKVILQRNNSGGVSTQSVLNSMGNLTAVPAVGTLANNLRNAATSNAAAAKTITADATPAWERYAIPVIGGAALLVGVIWAMRHSG